MRWLYKFLYVCTLSDIKKHTFIHSLYHFLFVLLSFSHANTNARTHIRALTCTITHKCLFHIYSYIHCLSLPPLEFFSSIFHFLSLSFPLYFVHMCFTISCQTICFNALVVCGLLGRPPIIISIGLKLL